MPFLNDHLCYKEQPKRPAIKVRDNLRADWFADFYDLLAKRLKLNDTEKKYYFHDHDINKDVNGTEKAAFINEFNRHAGPSSTFSSKPQLLASLRKLYCIYTDTNTSDDKRSLIASRIREDISQCSPGFTNRVNFLLTLFDIPSNFDELLAKARHALVDKIARNYAQKNPQGIHVHSRFFVIADTFGYGVPPINTDDVYLHMGSSDLSDEAIKKILAKGFKQHFGLFGIISELREQIENLMAMHGYKGKNQHEGSALYFDLHKLVRPFIDIKNDDNLLDINEDTLSIDVNWQHVNLMLFKKLTEEGYVDLSPEEATLWVSLLKSQNAKALNSLLPNSYELARCLEFFSEWTTKEKATLVMAYLNNKTAKKQETILTTLDDQTPQLTAQLKTEPRLQPLYYAIAIQKGDIAAVKIHLEKGANINAALGLLFSEDNKKESLYWLHENQKVVATITADGMAQRIANGKYNGKTVAEVLVNTKKGRQLLLENQRLQTVLPQTIANRSKEDYLKQAISEKQSINTLEGFFKKQDPLATQLGQYIVYGDLEKAEKMLKENPLLVEKLLTETVTVKDYSRRKCKGPAFELALSAMDDEMCEMLAKYMRKDEIARQYEIVFPEGHEKHYKEQQPFDFSAIIDAISQSSEDELDKALDLELPNTTALWSKLEQFRADFTQRSKAEKVFNPKHLIKAFELYDQKYDSWNRKQRDLFWRQVIGYTQRFLPANVAMVFAYSLYDVVEEHKKAPRSFKFQYGDGSIFPLTFDSLSGLGDEYAAGAGGRLAGGPSLTSSWAPAADKLMSNKNFALSKLMRRTQETKTCLIV